MVVRKKYTKAVKKGGRKKKRVTKSKKKRKTMKKRVTKRKRQRGGVKFTGDSTPEDRKKVLAAKKALKRARELRLPAKRKSISKKKKLPLVRPRGTRGPKLIPKKHSEYIFGANYMMDYT